MESKVIEEMIIMGNKIGNVTKVNMYNEDNIYIDGVT